jgi:hypothetical protein
MAPGSEEGGATLRVKVEDGVIIFPMSARGHQAVVEGVVERIELTAEQAREQAMKHAKEQGEPFDSTATFEAKTSYQLRGAFDHHEQGPASWLAALEQRHPPTAATSAPG